MPETLWRVEQIHGQELSFPVGKTEALAQVFYRMDHEPLGDPLKIVRIDYRLDPEEPPTIYTPAMRKVWRAVVLRFPEIGSLGVYVCKEASQHRYGNAGDWSASLTTKTTTDIVYELWAIARFLRSQGIEFEESNGHRGLPVSEVIVRDKITTRLRSWTWRDYGGAFHASHVHGSCYPLIATTRPCG